MNGKLECGYIVLGGHKLTSKDCAKCNKPKSLFYLCQKKVRQFPELEKQLFHRSLVLDFEFTFQLFMKNILQTVSTPYFNKNKSFERYFRNLVREHIVPSNNDAKDLLVNVQNVMEKIKSFRKIYGMVADVFHELHYLEAELVFLLNQN